LIRQLVAGFNHVGIAAGDTVLIHSFNNLYYPILVLGIIGSGGVFCGTNPSHTQGELKHAIHSSQAKIVICDILGEAITNASKECGIPSSKIFALNTDTHTELGTDEYASWRTLLTRGEADWQRFDCETKSRNTTACLFFSSGTTGLPKATKLSHYNLVAEHTLTFEHHTRPYNIIRRLVALPMFHVATAPSTHISALKAGHISVIMRRYDPKLFIDMVVKHRITDLTLVPPQVTSLLALPLSVSTKKDKLRSLRCIWGGGKSRVCDHTPGITDFVSPCLTGAPLDAVTQNAFQELLPSGSTFTQIWAMTETSCFACLFPYPENDRTGSVGRFLPNIDVKLLDDDGNDVTAFNKPGELAIRGPIVTSGYLGRPRSADFDDEGYFRTGDVMYCEAGTGKWYIVDRKKDLIKIRGFQVAPAEIEGVLLEHPHIDDAAVLGVKVSIGDGEMPRAYVVKKRGVELGELQVRQWVEAKLAKYKWLESVRFVESLPRTASGKILRRTLRSNL
jgi:4-coumarate--CoA ligase